MKCSNNSKNPQLPKQPIKPLREKKYTPKTTPLADPQRAKPVPSDDKPIRPKK